MPAGGLAPLTLAARASLRAFSERSQMASLPTAFSGLVDRFTSSLEKPKAPITFSTRSRVVRISSAIWSGRQKMCPSSCRGPWGVL